MGNKTKYSPALIKKLCGYIADGLNVQQACAASGIGVSTLRDWRALYDGLEGKLEAAREILRSKVLAQIRDAGANDWRAHAEFLRLAFPELRYGNGPSTVNVALQNNVNLADNDPERARLIEMRNKALAGASQQPLQLADAPESRREEALEAERSVGVEKPPTPEPERLREKPPQTVVERADLLEERRQWREAARRDEVEELLGD
jgi:hypothetical protein